MEERLARIIASTANFKDLAQFEANVIERDALTDEIAQAIRKQSAVLGRKLISDRTGIDLSSLNDAERRVVEAVSEYVGVMKRQGKDAGYTFRQLKSRGSLLEAVEAAVSKSRPTQGFETLTDVGREDISYENIVLDFPEEFSPRALWYSRKTLGLSNATERPPAKGSTPVQTRTELILQWLEQRSRQNGLRIPAFDNSDIGQLLGMAEMHRYGRVLGNIQSRIDFACYLAGLPPLGLAARTPFDLAWQQEDRDWAFPSATMAAGARSRVWTSEDFAAILRQTVSLPGQAHIAWKNELSTNAEAVRRWAYGIAAAIESSEIGPAPNAESPATTGDAVGAVSSPYWVFVCNPKKWAIDRFLEERIVRDTWGVNPHHAHRFAPGQLGIVRVGTDGRSVADRGGRPRLEPGIYALCEVESHAFPGTGAAEGFWADGAGREPGWPTVNIRYLRAYPTNPVTIARLRDEAAHLSDLLLMGHQAASFPISREDFHTVLEFLKEDPEALPSPEAETGVTAAQVAAAEAKYLQASPEVKIRLAKSIERGPVGALVKKANGYRCQLCEALGQQAIGFVKGDGQPYVEAHHVMPVSTKQIGSLAASNVMTLCANHHRQLHYDPLITVEIGAMAFEVTIVGKTVSIPRAAIATIPADPSPR